MICNRPPHCISACYTHQVENLPENSQVYYYHAQVQLSRWKTFLSTFWRLVDGAAPEVFTITGEENGRRQWKFKWLMVSLGKQITPTPCRCNYWTHYSTIHQVCYYTKTFIALASGKVGLPLVFDASWSLLRQCDRSSESESAICKALLASWNASEGLPLAGLRYSWTKLFRRSFVASL